MSNEEKSLFDTLWDEAQEKGPNGEDATIRPRIEVVKAKYITDEPEEQEPPAEEPQVEEPKAEEPQVEEPKAEEPAPKNEHTEKKQNVKFLAVYTTVFVIVITGLIAGSYMITSRIHKQMAESNEQINTSQSTLKNIQEDNAALREQNAALKAENEQLLLSQQEADALVESVSDMVEHGEYLMKAQNAYVRGKRADARAILKTVEREKLSPTAQECYDALQDRLK